MRITRTKPLWERALEDAEHTDAESLYVVVAHISELLALPVSEQAHRLSWSERKVYRVRAALQAKGWTL